jgi:hypothetical protein
MATNKTDKDVNCPAAVDTYKKIDTCQMNEGAPDNTGSRGSSTRPLNLSESSNKAKFILDHRNGLDLCRLCKVCNNSLVLMYCGGNRNLYNFLKHSFGCLMASKISRALNFQQVQPTLLDIQFQSEHLCGRINAGINSTKLKKANLRWPSKRTPAKTLVVKETKSGHSNS